jgi:predicted O-methyltransferase YrrM
MMNPEIFSDAFLKRISSPISNLLNKLEEETRREFPGGAHMLTGFSQGRLLSLLSNLMKPMRILEIGTFTGYGSLCLAEGLAKDGTLFTIEQSAGHARFASAFFEQSPFAGKIILLEGEAENQLSKLSEPWDLVYLDADKSSNRKYLEKVWKDVNPGGLVLIDNVFARGGILKPETEQKKFEKAVSELNLILPTLFQNGEVVVLPIRDGLSAVRKKS